MSLLGASALVASLTLTGCGLGGDKMDKSEEKSSSNVAEAKSSGLAPNWLPSEATSLKIQQRTTGDERLLVADYRGTLPQQCTTTRAAGQPSAAELKAAYAQDQKTQDAPVSDFTLTPLLSAKWWPAGQEKQYTALCGRWWVSMKDGKVYGWAAERQTVATKIAEERK